MSEWKKVKLGEITESCLGKMLDAAKNRGEYKPYLANLNVRWGSFDTDNLSLMKFEEDEDERYGIKYGDLIICEGGEPGRCAIWKDQIPDMKIQKALHRVRPKKGLVDNFYLFYWFLLAGKRNWIDQYCTGATIKHLPGQKLKEVVVDVPSLDTQHRIVAILSRYDSLIENYQKQIKLLEEAAQRLYKEWFVDLHFPEYENTKIVDGVPEGWEKKKVGDMISKIQRTKQVTTNNYQASGKIPVIDQSRNYIAGYTDDAECLVKVTVPYIVFGDHTRILKYIPFSFAKGADGTQLIMSNDLERMPQTLFYNSLIEIDLSNYSYARHFKYLKEEFVLLPSEYIARKYDSIVLRYYQSIQKSREQIRLLTEARDRLLPKLMSGEIAV